MEVIKILIVMNVHKCSFYITEMKENGHMKNQYEIVNEETAWTVFRMSTAVENFPSYS